MLKHKAFITACAFISLAFPRETQKREPFPKLEGCNACILQRSGQLDYIMRRWISPETGPDENESFGHCYVCIQCPGEIIPACYGWWPADPAGADYAGDSGKLQPDRREQWKQAACSPITESKAEEIIEALDSYEDQNDYHVLNENGRSCLGFCEDMSDLISLSYRLPWGDLTLTGEMEFPTAPLRIDNTDNKTATDLMFHLSEAPSFPISQGKEWKPEIDP